MTERLPTPGSDNNTWGGILNAFLGVFHNDDGTPKNVASVINAKDPEYGAFVDGVHDDYTALVAAVSALSTALNKRLYLPAGSWTNNTAQILLPAGTVVLNDGVKTVLTGYGFKVTTGCRIEGMKFVGDLATVGKRGISIDTTTAQTDVIIRSNLFVNFQQAIYLDRTADSLETERWKITENHFENCVSGVFAIRGNRHVITGNTFLSAQSNAQSILFYGGQENKITGNEIDYGKTGILFLYSRTLAGSRGVVKGNIVSDNTVKNCSEEHISFDIHGNSATEIAVFDDDTVASKANPSGVIYNITLTNAGWASAGSPYVGYYACFKTGALAGQVAKITAQTNGTMTLAIDAARYALITAGDQVIFGAPFIHNVIEGNTVDASARGTTYSILLYGLCYHNTVVGNTAVGKDIGVRSMNALVNASPQYTGTAGRAPNESNVVSGNTVVGADISLDYHDYGSSTAFLNYGNVVTGNIVRSGRVFLQQQLGIVSNNISNTTSGSGSPEGVITAPVPTEYVDITTATRYIKATGTGNTGWVAAGGGGGSVATDAIFDAKGDLAIGTGADTAARLVAGTDLVDVLVPDSSTATGLRWGRRRSALRPAGSLIESGPRMGAAWANGACLVSKRVQMFAIDLPVGLTITSITFVSATTALDTGVHQFFGIYNSALGLLRSSADATNAAWEANSAKTLALSSTFTTTYSGRHYVAMLIQATTLPSLHALNTGNVVISGLASDIVAGYADANANALPTPTAAALTVSNTYAYFYLS